MTAAALSLIEIPIKLWDKVPTDRPFRSLAADALASERRFLKGVDLGRERGRYTQLCEWIEQSALKLLHDWDAPHNHTWCDSACGTEATDYLRLLAVLQATPDLADQCKRRGSGIRWGMRRLVRLLPALFTAAAATDPGEGARGSTPAFVRRQPIGKSFYPPGDPVAQQQAIYAWVTTERLRSLVPEADLGALTACAALAGRKAEFYRGAHRRGSGVVEVLALAPS